MYLSREGTQGGSHVPESPILWNQGDSGGLTCIWIPHFVKSLGLRGAHMYLSPPFCEIRGTQGGSYVSESPLSEMRSSAWSLPFGGLRGTQGDSHVCESPILIPLLLPLRTAHYYSLYSLLQLTNYEVPLLVPYLPLRLLLLLLLLMRLPLLLTNSYHYLLRLLLLTITTTT
jgi:hypothetical protein